MGYLGSIFRKLHICSEKLGRYQDKIKIEKIKSRLEKCKWHAPSLSYRGRTLIINNLVAYSLWHHGACVDPSFHLLGKMQSVLLDFFGDKLHWTQKSV